MAGWYAARILQSLAIIKRSGLTKIGVHLTLLVELQSVHGDRPTADYDRRRIGDFRWIHLPAPGRARRPDPVHQFVVDGVRGGEDGGCALGLSRDQCFRAVVSGIVLSRLRAGIYVVAGAAGAGETDFVPAGWRPQLTGSAVLAGLLILPLWTGVTWWES